MTAMNSPSWPRIAAALLACAGASALAADAPAPKPVVHPAEPATVDKDSKEPVVQRTVIDDGRAVIEELRVRGQLVKVTVHPKDGSPSYEIIVGESARDLPESRTHSGGTNGKRVWNIFRF
jgi:Protein of unknown function (DUF2782)